MHHNSDSFRSQVLQSIHSRLQICVFVLHTHHTVTNIHKAYLLDLLLLLDLSFSSFDIVVEVHTDLAQNLRVDFISLLFCVTRVHDHVHLVIHHILLHFHLLALLCELFQHIPDLRHVHAFVHLCHHLVDTFERIHHLVVNVCSVQL